MIYTHHKCLSSWLSSVAGDLDIPVTHNSEYPKIDGRVMAVHVVRDLRDAVVSAYFSHRYSHSLKDWLLLVEHRKLLELLPVDDGLLLEIDFSAYAFSKMDEWCYENPNILELHAEEAMAGDDGLAMWQKIVAHLRFTVKPEVLQDAIHRNRFQSHSGREPGVEDVRSHYRKGISGDWKNYLGERYLALIKARWGKTMKKMGYEWQDV